MRNLARVIVIAILMSGSQCDVAPAQGPFGWLPFREKEKETFVYPPSSLGAGAVNASEGTTPATSTATAATEQLAPITPVTPAQSTAGSLPPTAPPATGPAERTSFLPTFAWPKFQMPYFPKPQMPRAPFLPGKPEMEQTRNTWVAPGSDPTKPSPWQAVTTGASRVGQSTKGAWRKTVDVLTPGSSSTPPEQPRVAQRDSQPSLWNRMFSPGPPKKEGPQTVTEWMGQDRIRP